MGIGQEPANFTLREITRFEMLHRIVTECEDCHERVFVGGDLDWIHVAQVMALWRDVFKHADEF